MFNLSRVFRKGYFDLAYAGLIFILFWTRSVIASEIQHIKVYTPATDQQSSIAELVVEVEKLPARLRDIRTHPIPIFCHDPKALDDVSPASGAEEHAYIEVMVERIDLPLGTVSVARSSGGRIEREVIVKLAPQESLLSKIRFPFKDLLFKDKKFKLKVRIRTTEALIAESAWIEFERRD